MAARGYFVFAYLVKEGGKCISKQVALKKPIMHKWQNENPLTTSLKWNITWHKTKAQKEVTSLWLGIHKVVTVNECCGKISVEIDKSCPHCGPQ